MFYLSSVLFTILVNNVSDMIIKKKIKDRGYIFKSKKKTTGNLIGGIISTFTPILNLLSFI